MAVEKRKKKVKVTKDRRKNRWAVKKIIFKYFPKGHRFSEALLYVCLGIGIASVVFMMGWVAPGDLWDLIRFNITDWFMLSASLVCAWWAVNLFFAAIENGERPDNVWAFLSLFIGPFALLMMSLWFKGEVDFGRLLEILGAIKK